MDLINATETKEGNCFHFITLDSMPKPYNIFYVIVLSIIMLYGGVSNAFLLYATFRTTVKYSSTQILFIILSVSDIWTAMIVLPIQIYIANLEPEINCLTSLIQVFTAYHTPWNSGLIICAICLTRYITVTTKRMKEFLDGKRLALVVFLNFLLALALAFWQAFSFFQKLPISLSLYYFLAGSFALFLLTVIIFSNCRLIAFLRKTRRKSATAKSRYQVRVTKTVLIISITTLICYTPMIIAWMVSGHLYFHDVNNRISSQIFNSWSQVLVYLNCGIGPTIYIISSGLVLRLWNNWSNKKKLTNKFSDQELKPVNSSISH